MRGNLIILGAIEVILILTSTHVAIAQDYIIEDGEYWEIFEVSQAWFGKSDPVVDMTGGVVGDLGHPDTGMFTRDLGTLNVSGGTIHYLRTYNSSTVNISEGEIGDFIGVYDSSTVNLSGGFIGYSLSLSEFHIYNSGTVNIDMSSGWVGALTFAQNSSTVNVCTGSLNHLAATDSSTVTIFGGTVGSGWGFGAEDSSTVYIYGGTIGWNYYVIPVDPTATINIYGYNFSYDPQAFWWNEVDGWISELTGVGPTGTPITIWGLPDPSTSPNIYLLAPGDMDKDDDVDLEDFTMFSARWQDTGCGACGGANFTCEGTVDIEDLIVFVENWLSGIP